jgi:hypothetical protein
MVTTIVKWTPEEIEWLRENYHKLDRYEIYEHLSRHNIDAIKSKATVLRLKARRYWRKSDLQYLRENYGVLSLEEICKHLKRTEAALHIICVRQLHICQKSNYYTARGVAKLFDIKCSKTVTAWMNKGWLKGCRSHVNCGATKTWYFTRADIETFVRSRPTYFDLAKMPDNEFRQIVSDDFARDPWYSMSEACKMIGVSYNSAAMSAYIRKKWLHPTKTPIEGGNHWTWFFRKSDIDSFLANDPRKKAIKAGYDNRKLQRLRAGHAVEMCAVWQMLCPICKKSVLIRVKPHVRGYEIRKLFVYTFCIDGECSHKNGNNLNRVSRPEKPYTVRKSSGRKKISPPNWPDRKQKILTGVQHGRKS